jgi:CRP/FNR family cyclic AMP-dependent transcriptional regulator
MPVSQHSSPGNAFALLDAAWALDLTGELRRRVVAETLIRSVRAGGYVCRKGEPVTAWVGVLKGLVKLSSTTAEGRCVTFTGVPTGGWFGEGSLLKSEPRRYDAIALKDSTIAYVPRRTFMLLLDTNVGFNRFLLIQLNERLGQFIGMVEHDRSLPPESRVASELAVLFNPILYPGNRDTIAISQEELANLVGLSRQRTNRALKSLAQSGLIRVDYRGVRVLDVEKLRDYATGKHRT